MVNAQRLTVWYSEALVLLLHFNGPESRLKVSPMSYRLAAISNLSKDPGTLGAAPQGAELGAELRAAHVLLPPVACPDQGYDRDFGSLLSGTSLPFPAWGGENLGCPRGGVLHG